MENFKQLKRDSKFFFSCKKEYSCFNQCCTDTNIFLTPYDVLRIRQHLNISSEEFLEKYTIQPFTKEQKLPVVLLKLLDDEKKQCPFVREEGCSIYEDRPWSCRMYPVGLASQKTRIDDPGTEFFFLQTDDFCEGHQSKQEWTIDEWMQNQGIGPYEYFSTLFREIVLHPKFEKGQDLNPQQMEMFHMVFYNLDKFRTFVFESTFTKRFDIAKSTLDEIKKDDLKLMTFGVDWLKFCLFAEDTIKIRGDVTNETPDNKAAEV
jgi:Fe-S-cluster containining protein